jgi:hypothetical protein
VNVPARKRFTRLVSLDCPSFLVVIGVVLGLGQGCAGLSEKTAVGESVDAVLTSSELRASLQEFSAYAASEVESSANRAARACDDPVIGRNIIDWKTNATSAIYFAAFHEDPWVATFDVRVLILQMLDFLQEPRGEKAFGPYRDLLLSSMKRLNDSMFDLTRKLRKSKGAQGDGKLAEMVAAWAKSHPIQDLEFLRDPVAFEFATLLGKEEHGAMASIEEIEHQVKDAMNRTRMYAAYLPKQARWQARLILDETLNDRRLANIFRLTDSLDARLDTATQFMQRVPNLVATERRQVMNEVNATTTEAIGRISAERQIVLEAIRYERKAVFDSIREERLALAEDLDQKARRLVDHAALRLLQVGAVFAGLVVLTFLVLRLFSRAPQRK